MRYAVVPLAAVLAAGGCYTYQPVPLDAAPAGRLVRVGLTDEGRRRLATTLGPEVEWVSGNVMSVDSVHVTLNVATLRRVGGLDEAVEPSRPVAFDHADVATLGVRRVAAGRSALVAGVIGAGAFTIGHSIGGDQEGSRSGNSGTPSPK